MIDDAAQGDGVDVGIGGIPSLGKEEVGHAAKPFTAGVGSGIRGCVEHVLDPPYKDSRDYERVS